MADKSAGKAKNADIYPIVGYGDRFYVYDYDKRKWLSQDEFDARELNLEVKSYG